MAPSASVGVSVCGVVLAIIIAYMCKIHLDNVQEERLYNILSGLVRAEEKATTNKARIAVGFGGCRDIVLNARDLLDKLNVTLPKDPYHVDTVNSKEDLANLFAYFFRYGAAVERYVANKELFAEVRRALEEVPNSHKKEYVAGAAPTMAKNLVNEGAEVLLGSRFTQQSLNEIAPAITVAGTKLDIDDLHIILEYKVNEVMGPYTAPRDNRAIIHSDSSSPYMDALDQFIEEVELFKPALVIIAGMQMMDNFPFKDDERVQQLIKLRTLLRSLPLSTKIHLEMASFTEQKFVSELIEYIIPYVDSMGMNEQELPNIATVISGGDVTIVSDSKPRIATVLDDMRTLYDTVTALHTGSRRFSRIHVHTLAYQAILTDTTSDWKNTMAATAKASLMAHRYTCRVTDVDTSRAKLIVDESFLTSVESVGHREMFDSNQPVSCWNEGINEICVAPVLVCTKVYQTAGAGDHISSSGIVLQI